MPTILEFLRYSKLLGIKVSVQILQFLFSGLKFDQFSQIELELGTTRVNGKRPSSSFQIKEKLLVESKNHPLFSSFYGSVYIC